VKTVGEKNLMKGNEAIGEAAIIAGCRHYFGYPITPQSELIEYMARRMPEVDGVFLQGESEVAVSNMLYGAAGAGVRVMTSSSGPGISLMQEGISCMAGAELPCVIVDVMRGGPGLGSIQPGQGDYFQATKGGGHGDYSTIVLAPNSVQEMADLTILAFDLADKYRNPVILLADGTLGQMMEAVEFAANPSPAPAKPWATTGLRGRSRPNIINMVYLNQDELEKNNTKIQKKYDSIRANEPRFQTYGTEDADLILVAYGVSSRIAQSAMEAAREQGLKVGMIRPVTLWPFPAEPFAQLARTAKAFLVLELSAGQMVEDVRLAVKDKKPVKFYGRLGGMYGPKEILSVITTTFQEEAR
jgi:2-oxoglutarate ferredoxin oxidoreductase subunit alpha